MTEARTENEIKLTGSGGPLAFDPQDPQSAERRAVAELDVLKIAHEPFKVRRFVDEYYTDPGDTFDEQKIFLRYRDEGATGYVTIKKPSVHNGLGLSRREIETEVHPGYGFDKFATLQDQAQHYLARTDLAKVPKLKVDTVRCEARIQTAVRRYTFDLDRYVYVDPATGRAGEPHYEVEIESLDTAIEGDSQILRLADILSEKYLFAEVRESKYARGRVWLATCRV